MLTFDEAAQMAWAAFTLTPEGEALEDAVADYLHTNRIPDTSKNRAVTTTRMLLADRDHDRLVWPALQRLLQEAAAATNGTP